MARESSIFTYLLEKTKRRRSSFSTEMGGDTHWQLRNRMEAKKAVSKMTPAELVAKAEREFDSSIEEIDEEFDDSIGETPEDD